MITQERLMELLNYDQKTGVFAWRVSRGRCSAGKVAGSRQTNGYIHIMIDGQWHRAHRLAWLWVHGYLPEPQIDHVNGIRTDNKISNLRMVSNTCNAQNARIRSTNKVGLKGVEWHQHAQKFRARVKYQGKSIHLGYHNSYVDAAKARRQWEEEHPELWSCDARRETERALDEYETTFENGVLI